MRHPIDRLTDLVTSGGSWLGWRGRTALGLPAPQGRSGARTTVRLIVQPDDGLKPIVEGIASARRTLDVSIFRMDSARITNAVRAAIGRGVSVRALVAHRNSAGERELRALEEWLLNAGATVCRSHDKLLRYHQKMMLVDRRTLYVFGFNFTHLDIQRSRSFGLVFRDPALVEEAIRLFEADCGRKDFTPRSRSLVLSPHNARARLSTLIRRARHSLLIYDGDVSDVAMTRLLIERAKAGVDVRIIGHVTRKGTVLRAAPYAGGRLHVRAIIQDARCAFVGSQGLRRLELDRRRELGVIVADPAVVRTIVARFEKDWTRARRSR